jgi:hypothetical protein
MAAEAMRRILIENARRKKSPKHGAGSSFKRMTCPWSPPHFKFLNDIGLRLGKSVFANTFSHGPFKSGHFLDCALGPAQNMIFLNLMVRKDLIDCIALTPPTML